MKTQNIEEKMTELKGKIDNSTKAAADVNILL